MKLMFIANVVNNALRQQIVLMFANMNPLSAVQLRHLSLFVNVTKVSLNDFGFSLVVNCSTCTLLAAADWCDCCADKCADKCGTQCNPPDPTKCDCSAGKKKKKVCVLKSIAKPNHSIDDGVEQWCKCCDEKCVKGSDARKDKCKNEELFCDDGTCSCSAGFCRFFIVLTVLSYIYILTLDVIGDGLDVWCKCCKEQCHEGSLAYDAVCAESKSLCVNVVEQMSSTSIASLSLLITFATLMITLVV
jgi:hypothetical protein